MKADGLLNRNWLKGALRDAMHSVMCGALHNLWTPASAFVGFLRAARNTVIDGVMQSPQAAIKRPG